MVLKYNPWDIKASTDAEFVTKAASSALANERVLTDTATATHRGVAVPAANQR